MWQVHFAGIHTTKYVYKKMRQYHLHALSGSEGQAFVRRSELEPAWETELYLLFTGEWNSVLKNGEKSQ